MLDSNGVSSIFHFLVVLTPIDWELFLRCHSVLHRLRFLRPVEGGGEGEEVEEVVEEGDFYSSRIFAIRVAMIETFEVLGRRDSLGDSLGFFSLTSLQRSLQ